MPTPVTLFIDQLTAAKGRADRSGTTRTRGATASALALLTPELRRPPARPFCAPVRPVFTIQRRRRREERVETMTFAENQKLPKTKLALHIRHEKTHTRNRATSPRAEARARPEPTEPAEPTEPEQIQWSRAPGSPRCL